LNAAEWLRLGFLMDRSSGHDRSDIHFIPLSEMSRPPLPPPLNGINVPEWKCHDF